MRASYVRRFQPRGGDDTHIPSHFYMRSFREDIHLDIYPFFAASSALPP